MTGSGEEVEFKLRELGSGLEGEIAEFQVISSRYPMTGKGQADQRRE